MPLHLLGKKSWNVYNTANIERVRRDEEEARLKEEAEEQRQQQEDSAKRIGLLRGQPEPPPADASDGRAALVDASASRKRRRMHGEDDTDRDLRYAREDIKQGEEAIKRLRKDDRTERLYDDHGHLQLFGAPDESKTALKPKSTQTVDTFGEQFNTKQPWYASNDRSTGPEALSMLTNTDVWGREDGRRKDREVRRMTSSDPLAAMKAAQSKLKRSNAEKAQWTRERQIELDSLARSQAERKARRRRSPNRRDKDHHRSRHSSGREEGYRSHRKERRDNRPP